MENYMNDLNKALEIATLAHKGQLDKSGKDYINHPIAVSNKCKSLKAKIVGLLHDVVEDTSITLNYLKDYFTDDIIIAIDLLTKKNGLDINIYYKNIKANPLAKEVKIADLTHNMDLSRFEKDKITQKDLDRVEKYKKYYDYLINDDQNIIKDI